MTQTICPHCEEPVLPEDKADPHHTMHLECLIRTIVGSVAHLQNTCSCCVLGSTDGDPEGMTRREAARASYNLWLELERLGVKTFHTRREM